MSHPLIQATEAALNISLSWQGNVELLERAGRRALLVSRAEGPPTPGTPCVLKAIAAGQAIGPCGEVLVAGAGRVPWDLALTHCRNSGGRAIIALTGESQLKGTSQIAPADALFVWAKCEGRNSELVHFRDSLVGLLADSAYLIDVRPGGNMERVTADLRLRGCAVSEWVGLNIQMQTKATALTCAPCQPPKDEQVSFARRLTHFTREPNGAWPGESRAEYLEWLSSGLVFEPRDAFAALRRILTERKISACGRLISGATPMVCFTAAEPSAILAQRRWRKGLRRWSFSSYAISFLADDLLKLGARSVEYAARETIQLSVRDDQCFMQIAESSGEVWEREAEWRMKGDLDFSRVAPERIVALVSNAEEAAQIESEFGIQALAIASPKL